MANIYFSNDSMIDFEKWQIKYKYAEPHKATMFGICETCNQKFDIDKDCPNCKDKSKDE